MDVDPHYPWVRAMHDARQRLSRLKAGVAVAGAVVLGAVAALAAAASPAPAAQPPGSAAPPTVDVFGQGPPPGPDNQPSGMDPANPNPGGNQGQGTPGIVTAPS